MKHILKLMAIATVALTSAACAGKKPATAATDDKKVLVCYFSATGTTQKSAERIARITGGDLFVIEPQTPYTGADLDWNDAGSRSSVEMHDSTSRPAIKGVPDNLAGYDVVFLGYPNWWNLAPTVINTFIEQAHLEGKKVVPFMTSGSSSIDNSEAKLREAYPEIKWRKGLRTNGGATEKQITDWARGAVYGD